MVVTETAYAKINLALHVRRRRDDGYHEMETLFAFVDAGDTLTFEEADEDRLTISGEFSDGLASDSDNLVMRALRLHNDRPKFHIHLEKRLPVAAGLGGGSADAGAVIRYLRRFGYAGDGSSLGADVPACAASTTCIGRGTGTDLTPIKSDLAGIAVLLVNPRVPLTTGPVFAAWDGEDRGSLPEGPASRIAVEGRNDLEAPAIALCPPISNVLNELREGNSSLVRMSGSGATCFALYPDEASRDEDSKRVATTRPDWWQMKGCLR